MWGQVELTSMSYFEEEHHIPQTWLDAILDLLGLGLKWLVLGHLDGEVDYEIEFLNGLVILFWDLIFIVWVLRRQAE